MQVKELKTIISHCEGKVDEEVLAVLNRLVGSKEDHVVLDLLDRNDYFATVLWSESDITGVLESRGIEPTADNVAKVINHIRGNYMDTIINVSEVWEYAIYPAVDDVFGKASNEDIA